ncbi:hypothetical protein pdam_00022502 [Pocillopora damicornis]|uniref:HECT domain-containing protein n=1 Tax=Pocillopora damicornis TaxID=46731 RepID=A0A3M6TCC9_POCDA|nr:hypothetical protein pdam_00022502 [Pocillopora damicornis]
MTSNPVSGQLQEEFSQRVTWIWAIFLYAQPSYVADAWREALVILNSKEELTTIQSLCHLYQTVVPNRKVQTTIQANPQNNLLRAATEFLKCFVRVMDKAQLKSFLRYVTGADVICVPYGFARRPIAHTCGSVLELPFTMTQNVGKSSTIFL